MLQHLVALRVRNTRKLRMRLFWRLHGGFWHGNLMLCSRCVLIDCKSVQDTTEMVLYTS